MSMDNIECCERVSTHDINMGEVCKASPRASIAVSPFRFSLMAITRAA
jgi:hypothetical protein